MMGMGIRLEQRMILECTACGRSMSDHAQDCPQGALERLWNSVPRGRCPACHKADVLPNRADFFECRRCRVQFSRGQACGEDCGNLKVRFLDIAGETDLVQVVRMDTPGTGDFPILERSELLRAKVKAARAARRAFRKEYDRVLKLELKKAEKGGR